jgi:hypothetical protein
LSRRWQEPATRQVRPRLNAGVRCMEVGVRIVTVILAFVLATVARGAPVDVSIGEYRATIESNDTDVFHLYKSGVLVRQIDDFVRLSIGDPLEHGSPALAPGTDVNADGVPDLVIFGWNGGAHCCFVAWVFSLGADFETLAEVDGGHTEVKVHQADDDPAIEFAVRDWTLAYWPFGFGGSPSVEVILDWHGKVLEPSAQLTEEVAQWPKDLDALSRQYASDPSWADSAYGPIGGLFAIALGLVYSGESDRAAEFILDSWGGDRVEMVRLTIQFGRLLTKSRYLGAIESQRAAMGNGAR